MRIKSCKNFRTTRLGQNLLVLIKRKREAWLPNTENAFSGIITSESLYWLILRLIDILSIPSLVSYMFHVVPTTFCSFKLYFIRSSNGDLLLRLISFFIMKTREIQPKAIEVFSFFLLQKFAPSLNTSTSPPPPPPPSSPPRKTLVARLLSLAWTTQLLTSFLPDRG